MLAAPLHYIISSGALIFAWVKGYGGFGLFFYAAANILALFPIILVGNWTWMLWKGIALDNVRNEEKGKTFFFQSWGHDGSDYVIPFRMSGMNPWDLGWKANLLQAFGRMRPTDNSDLPLNSSFVAWLASMYGSGVDRGVHQPIGSQIDDSVSNGRDATRDFGDFTLRGRYTDVPQERHSEGDLVDARPIRTPRQHGLRNTR